MDIKIKEAEQTIKETIDFEYLLDFRITITLVMHERSDELFNLSKDLQENILSLYTDVETKTLQIKKITRDINKITKKIAELQELKEKLNNRLLEL